MNSEKGSKINRLLRVWPHGTVAVLRWLEKQGIYQQLVHTYEKSAWIQRIGQGAYMRMGDTIHWTGALYTIQTQMDLPIHVGGKTALEMQGYAHYLPLGQSAIVGLFGTPGTRLPTWFQQYNWGVTLRYTTTKLIANTVDVGLTQKDMGTYAITTSTPERAIMEVLYGIPRHASFDEAALLMEGLTTLRPRVLQELLVQCRSVKIKRLFMVLAEECNHAWVKKLDVSQVDFGKGKRMMVKGGRFDAKYNITIPITDPTRHASVTSS